MLSIMCMLGISFLLLPFPPDGVGSVLSYELDLCGMVDEVQVWVGPNQDCKSAPDMHAYSIMRTTFFLDDDHCKTTGMDFSIPVHLNW